MDRVLTDLPTMEHPELDAQHAGLYEIINRIESALANGRKSQTLNTLLLLLSEEADFHFRREEAVMAACGYPGQDFHRALHIAFSDLVTRVATDHRSGLVNCAPPVIANIRDWFRIHIDTQDRLLADHLRAHPMVTP